MQRLFLAAAGAALLMAAPAAAQVRASERGVVSQTVDGTTITIDYARPQVRGRDSLYGGIVTWGKVWTGANWATTFTANRPVTVAGQAVPAGTWSVWFQVGPETWTLILDPEPRRFHILPPDSSAAQIRAVVTPVPGPHVELLTWSFEDVQPTGTTLRFAWGDRTVTLPITVEPSLSFAMSAQEAARYTGQWAMETHGMMASRSMSMTIAYENGRLTGRWEGAPNPYLRTIWFAPRGAGFFWPGETDDGALWDVLVDLAFEFTPAEGRAERFELRGLFDELWAVGTRQP